MRKMLIIGLIVGAVAFAAWAWPAQTATPTTPGYQRVLITLGDTTITADVSDTEALRELGLSGREPLHEDQGMLFVFQEDGEHAFWMKDMKFSIDMIWLSRDKRVVYIAKNAAPESYPSSFVPDTPSRYVIEVPAGFSDAHRISVGATVEW